MRNQQRVLGSQIDSIKKKITTMNQKNCLFDVREILKQLYNINFLNITSLENWLLDQTNYVEHQILRKEENFLENFMDVRIFEEYAEDNEDILGFEDLEREIAEHEAIDDPIDDNLIIHKDDEDLSQFLSKCREFCHITAEQNEINLLYVWRQEVERLINLEYSYELHREWVAINRNIHILEQRLHYLRVSSENETKR